MPRHPPRVRPCGVPPIPRRRVTPPSWVRVMPEGVAGGLTRAAPPRLAVMQTHRHLPADGVQGVQQGDSLGYAWHGRAEQRVVVG